MHSFNKDNLSRIGSLASVFINIAIIIVVNIYYTRVPFLSSDFYTWIPIFNTMVGISIIGYFILFLVNTEKFKIFLEFITASFGVWGFYNLYKIFPFDFDNTNYSTLAHIIIIFIIIGCLISILVNFIKLLTNK